MRPYLAIIKDSFREAFASRVLWIMLVLITALLLALAPMGIGKQLSWKLGWHDVRDFGHLATQITEAAQRDGPSPGKHIWGLMDAETRKALRSLSAQEEEVERPFLSQKQIIGALNTLLARSDFYDAASFKGVSVMPETEEFLKRPFEDLSQEETSRLNRLMLEAAYPNAIHMSPPTSVNITCFGWTPFPAMAFPCTADQLEQGINWMLMGSMKVFVGVISVFVAILVTSSIMPRTFESGSVELLLSKPITRTMLFLSKYVGGCAFVLLNAAYLIGGLWLLVGLRLGIWNHRVLLCIPIFLFIFAIYYSVSALAGLIWRGAIVSVVMTILFWGTCLALGTCNEAMKTMVIRPKRIVRLDEAGETLIGVKEWGTVQRWHPDERQWQPIFQPEDEAGREPGFMPFLPSGGTMIGPVYDAGRDQLISVQMGWRGVQSVTQGPPMWVADRSETWHRREGTDAPEGTTALLVEPDGSLIALGTQGIFRLVGDPGVKRENLHVLGVELPFQTGQSAFRSAGPDPPLPIFTHCAVAIHPDDGLLAVYNRGTLTILARQHDGMYRRSRERKIDEEDRPALLALTGTTLLLAYDDGRILVIDVADLSVRDELRLQGRSPVRSIEAAPGGRWFALVFQDDKLHVFDTSCRTFVPRRILGQGDISAAAFVGPNLLVVDRATRVREYDLAANKRLGSRSPRMTLMERIYRYGIVPLYTIYPKPGELDNTILYLLTDRKTVSTNPEDMSQAHTKLDPWTPVWSSALFAVFLLAVSCVYLWRVDL